MRILIGKNLTLKSFCTWLIIFIIYMDLVNIVNKFQSYILFSLKNRNLYKQAFNVAINLIMEYCEFQEKLASNIIIP